MKNVSMPLPSFIWQYFERRGVKLVKQTGPCMRMEAKTPLERSIELSCERTETAIVMAMMQFQAIVLRSTPHFQSQCHKFIFPMALYLSKQLLDANQSHDFGSFWKKFRKEFPVSQQAIIDQFIREGSSFVMPAFDLTLDPFSLDYLRERIQSSSRLLSVVFETYLAPSIEPLPDSHDLTDSLDVEHCDHSVMDLPDIAHMTMYNHYDSVSDLKLARGLDILSVAQGAKVTIHALNEGCVFPNETSACDILHHRMRVTRAQFSHNSSVICSGSIDGDLRLAHTEACKQVRSFEHHKMPITDVQFSSNSGLIAAACLDKTVSLWSPNHPQILKLFNRSKQPIYCMCFGRDDRSLCYASSDGYIRVCDIGEERRIVRFRMDVQDIPVCVRKSPVDETIICGWSNGTIKIYDAADPSKEPRTSVVENLTDIQFTSDGTKAIVGSLNSCIAVFDLMSPSDELGNLAPPKLLQVDASTVDTICVSRDNLIATVGRSTRGCR